MKKFFASMSVVIALVGAMAPVGTAQGVPYTVSASLDVPGGGMEGNPAGSYIEAEAQVGFGITTYRYRLFALAPVVVQRFAQFSASSDEEIVINSFILQTSNLLEGNIISISPSGTLGQWSMVETIDGVRFEGFLCVVCEFTVVTNTLPTSGGFMASGSNALGDTGLLYSAGISSSSTWTLGEPFLSGYMPVPGGELNTFTGTPASVPSTLALALLGAVFLVRIRRGVR